VTNKFFVEAPQKIFAHLMTYLPTPAQLVAWMSDPAEIDRRVKGTEYWMLIDPRAPHQRTGVLGSLNMTADSFRLLPNKDDATATWTATKWAETRQGWIFITSQPTMREALRPLISLWIDLLVLRLLNEPMPQQKPVWFVIDELASVQRLPQLHTAITENRKSQNPVILGFQGRSQMEARYGDDAEAMLSQPATKIFLRTTEPRAAKWVSEAIGEVEIERLRETHYEGTRAGKNFALDRQTEPLVMPSEISGLDDLRGFLKYGNHGARLSFPFIALEEQHPGFSERAMDDLLVPRKQLPGPASGHWQTACSASDGRTVRVDAEARRKAMTTAARHVRRQETARRLLDDIRSKIEAAQSVALPSSTLSKACQYALTLWKKLTRFLEYPELELSNNLAENSMRPVALGRKNWLHIGSPQAGPKVAAILSIVESCRRLKLPVRDYLATILPGLADLPIRALPDLTPAVWVAQHSDTKATVVLAWRDLQPRRFCASI
jgi:hypothetical protein